MTTIAIVGAGRGLGQAVAHRFGCEGFAVALVARSRNHLDMLARDLVDAGITARGYVADVREPDSLRAALDTAAHELGAIQVLQYSPVPAAEFMKPVLETTPADLLGPIETSIYGPVTATQQVIPGMGALGSGTIIFVNGASAVHPSAQSTGTSIAFAGESTYGQLLHAALADHDIYVSQLIILRGIGGGEPSHEPDALAETIWNLHTDRSGYRTYVADLTN